MVHASAQGHVDARAHLRRSRASSTSPGVMRSRVRESQSPESAAGRRRESSPWSYFFAGDVTDTVNASVHVMSTRSPTLTLAKASLSATRDE